MIRAAFGLAIMTFSTVTSLPVLAAQVRHETFGCKSLAATERLETLQQGGNPDSYRQTLSRQLSIGQCRIWTIGEQVTPKDEEDAFVCFAPENIWTNCYWSPRTMVE